MATAAAARPGSSQQVTVQGLRSIGGQGAFSYIIGSPAGNLYALFSAGDGVRVYEFDSTATQLLNQVTLGSAGDTGVALSSDPAGNIYVTGTSTGSLTGTSGTAFPSRTGTSTNSFLAKLDGSLRVQWISFLGSGEIAASAITSTSDAVFVTGPIFSATLPVTPSAIEQQPLPGSITTGFVESFSAAGQLRYATYLDGANGTTTPAALAADTTDHLYVAGTTTSTGFPTINALVPELVSADGSGTSGFLTELTPGGDGILFSTFVPGSGITSAALDPSGSGSVVLSGNIAAGLFPITNAQAPIAPMLEYQSIARIAVDGSQVLSSTLLAPGTQSAVAVAPGGYAWVSGSTQYTADVPLLPVPTAQDEGNAFGVRLNASGIVDTGARFGGLPVGNNSYASLPALLPGVTALSDTTAAFAGNIRPTMDASLVGTERFDLPLVNAPNPALPSMLRDAMPSAGCSGSACSGGAGFVAEVTAGSPSPSLALSADALPNLTLRNLGSAAASGIQVNATGYSVAGTCGTSLSPGSECDLLLTGAGPGSITVSASNAVAITESLPTGTSAGNPVSVTPKELDFGIETSGSAPVLRTLTLTNLSGVQQTVPVRSADIATHSYTLSQAGTTCAPAGDGFSFVLAPGARCTVTLALTASINSANDGAVASVWQVGALEIPLTGYAQAAALSVSSTTLDFGQRYQGGLSLPLYLYLSNSSDTPQAHTFVANGDTSFAVSDECPTVLQPKTLCRIAVTYQPAAVPSADATTLALDQGIQVQVQGKMVAQPLAGGASVNPNLSVSPAAVVFSQTALATTVSPETQTVTVTNSGAQPFPLALSTSGDFGYNTNCPATLAGNASCNVVLSFTPSEGGTRTGILSVTAGSATPVYVSLTGTATAILPANNGTSSFPDVPVGTPQVQWIHLSQPFSSLTATVSPGGNFGVLVVDNTGYGHGTPPATAFTASSTSTCYNCDIGVQYLPTASGSQQATLTISTTTGGKPQTIALNGNGIVLTTVYASPSSYNFGSVPLHSQSAPEFITITNGTPSAVTLTPPTASGDYTVSAASTGGTACSGTLAAGASCVVPVVFAPTASGSRPGTLTVGTGSGTLSVPLAGVGGADPGLALSPTSLVFRNVPGASATQQAVTITNTSPVALTVGTPTSSSAQLAATSNCGSLAPSASCAVSIAYTPGPAAFSGTVGFQITSNSGGNASVSQVVIPVSANYTSETRFIEITPAEGTALPFGTTAALTPGISRVLHVTNLSAQSLALAVQMPPQFALTANGCAELAPGAGCDLSVTYTPVTSGDTTGTVYVTGAPADGSATMDGLAYLEGYGAGAGTLQVTGNFNPNGVLEFGQVTSGSSAQQVITLTNPSTGPAGQSITVRHISGSFPFLATTTCGAPLPPGASCFVTVNYTPLNQIAPATSPSNGSDTGTLLIESDAANAPQTIELAGTSTPVTVASPNNTGPAISLQLSQGSLTFAATAVGSGSAAQTVSFVNAGSTTIHIFGTVVPGGFTATTNCATLAPGANCTATVSFAPQSSAPVVGSLEIRSDAAVSLQMISLFGQGTPGLVSISPTALDFGRVRVGGTSMKPVTFTNNGSVSLTFGAITASSGFGIAQASGPGICTPGGTLAPGASCIDNVVFSPASTGTVQGLFSVTTSLTSVPLTVTLSATGTLPQLQITPASLEFGTVPTGATSTLSVTIANTSESPVSGLSFSANAGYSVTSTCGIVDLQPGSSCAATVTVRPTVPGTLSGTLAVASSDPASPATVPLTTNAVQGGSFTLAVDGGSPASGTVAQGLPQTFTATVMPVGGFTGGVSLSCTPQGSYAYVYCSVNPALVQLAGTASQTATVTVNTISAVAKNHPKTMESMRPRVAAELCAMIPVSLLLVTRRRKRFTALLVLVLLLTGVNGCGSGDNRVRYAAPGAYSFKLTGSSTNGFPVSQTVTITVTVTPK